MSVFAAVPRRCVNLPPGSLRTLIGCIFGNTVQEGRALREFSREFGKWLGVPHVLNLL